ncbi:HAD-IIA family hydrolase [[Eubacterium] hominis]|uniref:HAD-IIA family hydrolase n=1 Tax=[Eubacterium] hominis TaxID=2764325 RepID=UPI003A4D4D71
MSWQNKTCFIDLDGTMYRGDELIDGAIEFIDYLQEHKIPYYFITNNAMRTHAQNAKKMLDMGFHHIKDEDFFTSAMASAAYVKRHEQAKKAYYIGQDGMKEALLEQGFIIDENEADHVFIGLDITATYEQYCRAFTLLQKGAKLVGTNADRRLPHGDGYRIGNGAIVAMFQYASEQEGLIIGKPNAAMMEEALLYAGIQADQCVMIGDNLETDILFGIQNDVETIFVTSGVHDEEDASRMGILSDIIVHNLKELMHK